MICFDLRCDRAILAGGFLMIIYGFVYSSLFTRCFGFLDSKIDAWDKRRYGFMEFLMCWTTGSMVDRVEFSSDSSVCRVLVGQGKAEKQMTIQ
jgi:hypothetical protein